MKNSLYIFATISLTFSLSNISKPSLVTLATKYPFPENVSRSLAALIALTAISNPSSVVISSWYLSSRTQ